MAEERGATRAETSEEVVEYCQRHPNVETALRCSRCGTLICPRCMVSTDVGARCPDCVRVARLPMYRVGPLDVVRALGVAVVVGAVLGVAGALLIPPPARGGLLFLALALLAGSGAGIVMAGAVSWATRHKRGIPVQLAALAGLVLAMGVRLLVGGVDDPELLVRDLAGIFAAVIAGVVAWNRLS